jgi:hypothetical protein
MLKIFLAATDLRLTPSLSHEIPNLLF